MPNVRSDCACVAAAPLGWPVVPEVKMRSETSSGCTAAARAADTAGSTSSPACKKASRPVGRDRGPGGRVARLLAFVAQQNDACQVAGVLTGQHGRVVEAQKAPHGHQRGGAGVADDVRRLAALEPRVERHDHRTGAQQSQRRQHPLGAIGCPQGGPLPRPDAGCDETAGEAVDLLGQLREREAQLPVDQRLRRAVAQRGVVDQAGHRAPDEVGPRVLLVGRRAADAAAHGCWLLTEMTSPDK